MLARFEFQALQNFTFPGRARLIKTDDFSSVFNFRKRLSGHFLAIHYQPNQLQMPRMGLIVSKKTARLSVDRNYMRRVLRELFRLNQHALPGVDMVVRCQRKFGPGDYLALSQEFLKLHAKLAERCLSQPAALLDTSAS